MKILITGGCGFIGSNVADYFVSKGHEITIYDNLSRPGVINNLKWLLDNHRNIEFIEANVENKELSYSLKNKDVIFHFAAQVGVQESIKNPRQDFNTNVLGTFNLLEHARKQKNHPFIIFASTNKVYGDIQVNTPVNESQPLSFCTPYGCSKGAAEQYVLDYSRVFDLSCIVLRMSCIYGTRQFGTEEQGWLCHFVRAKDITIYGDGTQIRDILYIDDYVRLCEMLIENKDKVKGQVFNIGGGSDNVISVNEALARTGQHNIIQANWRFSDQRYYVSDITKIQKTVGWEPKIGVDKGLEKLKEWVKNI